MQENEEDLPAVNDQSPNSARMYDYYLGGAANFAADRAAAEAAQQGFPEVVTWARANRSFLGRAVAHLCDQGIDQFLDLGSGVPTVGNVHEIAHRHNPAARVAYVDHEPVAVSHARNLLGDEPRVSITQADIRQPEQVLASPGVAGHLDFTRPVAVLAVAILHFIPDDTELAELLATYRAACAPGSYLALSHGVITTLTPHQVELFLDSYRHTPTPAVFRTPEQITAALTGYELLAPGAVPLDQWHPDQPVDDAEAARANCYAAVGYLPPSQ